MRRDAYVCAHSSNAPSAHGWRSGHGPSCAVQNTAQSQNYRNMLVVLSRELEELLTRSVGSAHVDACCISPPR